jgi:hypothetical protein
LLIDTTYRAVMEIILKQFKQLLITAALMLLLSPAFAQVKRPAIPHPKPKALLDQIREFYHLNAQANVSFTYPKGFVEIMAPNDEDFSFDYALELPGKDFEIWFRVKSEKENWASYEHSPNLPNATMANPDSAYNDWGKALVKQLTGDQQYYERSIPPDVLARYHADAGKSYLITLLDLPDTKGYKYALLITLQKNHTGTIMAVCLTNDKGPDFFKNINKASNCLKFKP